MARIPPKTVSKDDKRGAAHLERDLKRVVFGQDKAIEALAAAIKLARAGLREPEKPIGSTCSPARPASARPRSRASSPTRSASS
jgi:ATP-dependent Clp protease ATP-binding subunit ClpA